MWQGPGNVSWALEDCLDSEPTAVGNVVGEGSQYETGPFPPLQEAEFHGLLLPESPE